MRRRHWLVILSTFVWLTACGGKTDLGSAPGGGPQPYQASTPSPTATQIPPLTEVILPSPTPLTYTVVAGDTLSGIAQRFNVPLDDLVAANPGISLTVLTVGTVLRIPVGGNASGEPTPTPVPLLVRQARCWPTADGGVWCFTLVQNEYAEMLENISVQFTLLDSVGGEIASQVTFAPLNTLPPGQAMPVAVYFAAPVPANAIPRVQVLTAIRLPPSDPRYLPIALQNILVRVDWAGRTAQVTGQAVLTSANTSARLVWVLGVAYDAYGNIVGLRRWESTLPLTAGNDLPFEFTVFSLGPAIARVDFLIEARP